MSLFKPNAPDATRRLFVLPPAGGASAEFRRWPERTGLEVVPALLPGRETKLRQRPYRRMGPLVEDLADALPTDVPYNLYGHSVGAWIAFELAHLLRERGQRLPDKLGVGARQAPHHPTKAPPLGRLPESEFIEGMNARYDAIPAALLERPEVLGLFLPALRADVVLFEDYRHTPREPLDVELHVFHASDDPTVDANEALDWKQHTTGRFQLHTLTGGHFFHREHPERLLEVLG